MDSYQAIIEIYIGASEIYLQLGVGALLVTIVFREKIVPDTAPPGRGLLLTWVLLLLSIGCGALYPYLAGHFLSRVTALPLEAGWLPSYLERNPGVASGAQMLFFYLGAVSLVVTHLLAIRGSTRPRHNGAAPS